MPNAYLTIDDSPSVHTADLVKFLGKRKIPAILFVRGDLLEANSAPIVEAIRHGILIGNHSFAHKPAGDLGFEAWVQDFERAESLIDQAYETAGKSRTRKLFRFPYIDRGDGVRVERVYAAGQGKGFVENETTRAFQKYLNDKGFAQPFQKMPPSYPAAAADCLFTYTSADWMLTPRHKGQHAYKTLEDLKAKIDADEGLKDESHNHVLLLHDQPGIHAEVCDLIDYFIEKDFKFLTI